MSDANPLTHPTPTTDHRRLTLPNGHVLRVTRWAEGDDSRWVYRVMDDGGLVLLGTVYRTVPGIVYPLADLASVGNVWIPAVATFTDAAAALDAALTVTVHTVYAVDVNPTYKP